MSDDFDTAVARIHRRRFAWFLVEQALKLAAFIGLVAAVYFATRQS